MKVLVTGGTGLVGAATVDALVADGHTVRLLSRHAEAEARRWPRGVECWDGDVTSDAGVQGAAEGCQSVVHAVGIVAEDPPRATFQAVNVDGTRRIAREAKRAGVSRFVYVSSLGAERGASGYHRSKREAELVVLDEDPAGWLIVRPGNVYGPGDEVISLLLRLVRAFPAVPMLGWGDQPFQPIWHEDAGRVLAMAASGEVHERTALDLAGPEVTSTREVVALLSDLTCTRTVPIPIPDFLARLGIGVAGALGIEVPVTPDQITMLVEGNLIQPGAVNALGTVFPIPPTPLRDGLRRLIDQLPAQLPSSGQGAMHRERFWSDVEGSRLSPGQIIQLVREHFAELPPSGLVTVGAEEEAPRTLEVGHSLTLAVPLRGHVQVRVAEASERAITLVTVEGHFLAGAIRFLARHPDPSANPDESPAGGGLRFEVRSYTRAATTPDLIAMRMGGAVAQAVNWSTVVSEVVKRSGGRAPDGVQQESSVLDDREAARVEAWLEDLVLRLERAGRE